jgi:hypothetical protein
MSGQHVDPVGFYTQLDPAQRAAIAEEFIDRFRLLDDPGAREYARVDPHFTSPNQLAQMHEYAADMHPEVLADMLKNPTIASALGSPGAAKTEH